MRDLRTILLYQESINAIRKYFEKQDYLEYTVQILQSALPLEPNIYPFQTLWKLPAKSQKFYLSTSPEAELKKFLSLGVKNCFAISKSFRNLEGKSPLHTPEFLMLEWYRINTTTEDIKKEIKEFIVFLKNYLYSYKKLSPKPTIRFKNQLLDLENLWPDISLRHLFKIRTKSDLAQLLDDKNMFFYAKKKGYNIAPSTTWDQLFHQILLNEIEPHLPIYPFFLIDYPARISPLCSVQKTNPDFADRFELFIGRIEIANGNKEETQISKIEKSFDKEKLHRRETRSILPPLDYGFLSSLAKLKGRSVCGVGLGVERLFMLLQNIKDISILSLS